MTQLVVRCFFCIAVSLALPGFGQFELIAQEGNASNEENSNPSSATPAADTGAEADHEALRSLRDGMLESIKTENVDNLLAYMTDDVVLITQDGSKLKIIRKKDGVRSYMERLLTGPDAGVKSVNFDLKMDEKTILYGNDAGIAFGSSKDHYVLADGSEFDLATCWSATVVKTDGQWKVASLQLSTDLFENPVLDSAKRWLVWVGGVCYFSAWCWAPF